MRKGVPPESKPGNPDRFGDAVEVDAGWMAFAADDAVVSAPGSSIDDLLDAALEIARRERRQSALVRSGTNLREQFEFDEYLPRRAAEPARTFRRHPGELGGAIEEESGLRVLSNLLLFSERGRT